MGEFLESDSVECEGDFTRISVTGNVEVASSRFVKTFYCDLKLLSRTDIKIVDVVPTQPEDVAKNPTFEPTFFVFETKRFNYKQGEFGLAMRLYNRV